MRLLRSKRTAGLGEAQRATGRAQEAGRDADSRLAEAQQARADAVSAVDEERRGIIADWRAVRARNNLSSLILGGEGK